MNKHAVPKMNLPNVARSVPRERMPKFEEFGEEGDLGEVNDDRSFAPRTTIAPKVMRRKRGFRFRVPYLGFVIFVVAPIAAATVYYGFYASSIYAAVAQFVIRSPASTSASTGIPAFLQTTGLSNSSTDAQTLDAYVVSRDALRDLESTTDIRAIYNRPEADFLAKFPNFIFRPTFEYLYWHFEYWMTVQLDTSTNISTLTAYAFRPDDAQRVAGRLLELSEKYVNLMNQRALDDSVGLARREVQKFEDQNLDITKKITDFRNNELMLDPTATSTAALTRLATLQADLVGDRSQLSLLERSAPRSPQIQYLREQIISLEEQVGIEEKKDSGGANSLAPKMAVYQQLLITQSFAQQLLQASMTALESVEATVQSQQLYLERIEEPKQQDLAWYPYRTLDIFLVALTSLMIYGIGRMLASGVREHVNN